MTNRKKYIDVSKGTAILIVLITHVFGLYAVDSEIHNHIMVICATLHNPTFYFMSGVLFYGTMKKYDRSKILKNKFLDLVVVFAVWVVIYTMYQIILGCTFYVENSITGYSVSAINSLWFLPTLFCGMSAIVLLDVLKHCKHIGIIVKNDLLLCMIWLLMILVTAFYSSGMAKIFTFSYIVWKGYLGKSKKHIVRLDAAVWGINVASVFVLNFAKTSDMSIPGWRLALILFMFVTGSIIIPKIMERICEKKSESKVIDRLAKVGQNTVYIYILHFFVLYLFEAYGKINLFTCAICYVLCVFSPLAVGHVIKGKKIDYILFQPSKLLKRL